MTEEKERNEFRRQPMVYANNHYVRMQEIDTGMRFSYAWRKIQRAKKHGVSKEPTK